MDTEQLSKFAALHIRKKDLEAEVKMLSEEMALIEAQMINIFTEEGVKAVKVITPHGLRTCSLKRQLWTGATNGDWERACRALKESEDEALINMVQERFNIQTISAWVRERLRDDMGLPVFFRVTWEPDKNPAAPLNVTEKFNIGVTKA